MLAEFLSDRAPSSPACRSPWVSAARLCRLGLPDCQTRHRPQKLAGRWGAVLGRPGLRLPALRQITDPSVLRQGAQLLAHDRCWPCRLVWPVDPKPAMHAQSVGWWSLQENGKEIYAVKYASHAFGSTTDMRRTARGDSQETASGEARTHQARYQRAHLLRLFAALVVLRTCTKPHIPSTIVLPLAGMSAGSRT